eukprot:gene9454-1700_t
MSLALALRGGPVAAAPSAPRPVLAGDWWDIAGTPDLGDLGAPGMEPVDFGIWQAADGTWQVESCIRGTK